MILVVKQVRKYTRSDTINVRTDRYPGRDIAHCVELIPIPESNRRELAQKGRTVMVDSLGIRTELEIKGELKG